MEHALETQVFIDVRPMDTAIGELESLPLGGGGVPRKPPEWAKTKEKQMSTEKLSTGCELSTASLKKREGEKRHSPLNPYREKGKGKEQSRVSLETHSNSKPARAYASTHAKRRLPCTCTYDEAGAAADEIVGNCFGAAGDHGLWAWYCRHFDRERIVDKAYAYASMQRQREVRDAVTAFQAWLSEEYGKKGGAR